MSDLRQDTITKRKHLLRSDAVVGDDDNKVKPAVQQEAFKKHSSTTSHQSKDSCTDMMGVDVLQFIQTTLHKNQKDRDFVLHIEEELRKMVNDESIEYHFFPEMTSYNRMLVHRVAAFFGLIHNVDQSGKRVVVTKQKGITKIPDVVFSSLIKHSDFIEKFPFGNRRNVQSFDETAYTGRYFAPSRNFRSRFYTGSGDQNGEPNNRWRRARSFEAGDWYGGGAGGVPAATGPFQLPPQQFIGGGGEAMSSNCSSSASSSAIPTQLQSIHMYQQVIPLVGNEAGLLSPSSVSAFSEPVNPYQQPPPIYYGAAQKPGEHVITTTAEQQQMIQHQQQDLSEKEEEVEGAEEGGGDGVINLDQHYQQQQQSPSPQHHLLQQHNIPSLFSVHPGPPPQSLYAAYQQYYAPAYQAAYYQYQQVQPLMTSPMQASTPPSQYGAVSTTPYCYPNYQYYPVYQAQQSPIMQPHPLLEENNTRYLAEQLGAVKLNNNNSSTPELDEPKEAGKDDVQQQEELQPTIPGATNGGEAAIFRQTTDEEAKAPPPPKNHDSGLNHVMEEVAAKKVAETNATTKNDAGTTPTTTAMTTQ